MSAATMVEMNLAIPQINTYQVRDGRRLAVRVWQPAGPPRANVVFLHGVVSHGGWYTRSCAHLAHERCGVHFLERRGSGLNSADRGWGDVDRWQTWLDDVEEYLERLGGALPRILCGISWGGKLAAAVARHRPGLVDGLVLICPGIYAQQQPGLVKRCVLAIPLPRRVSSRVVRIPLDDPALFTHSPQEQTYVRDDPLALRRITLRFARADQRLTRYARQAPPCLQMPTLLVLAGRDRIVQNDRMRQYLHTVAAAEKTLLEYPEACHTLEFEPNPLPYCHDLAGWVRSLGPGNCAARQQAGV